MPARILMPTLAATLTPGLSSPLLDEDGLTILDEDGDPITMYDDATHALAVTTVSGAELTAEVTS